MRAIVAALAMTLLAASAVFAQEAAVDDANESWEFSASLYFYQVVDDRNYVQPSFTADRGRLHLSARYNYEDRDTASFWAGYNMSGGEAVWWELTPMFGGIVGNTDGVAPGYQGTVGWRSLEFYSEGEYVLTSDAANRFFFNWSELTISPIEWWRVGLVIEQTRAYESEREVQRGLLTGFTYKSFSSTIHIFNPDDTHPVVVVAATLTF